MLDHLRVGCDVPEELTGTWRLVSYQLREADGRVAYPLGERANGLIIYDHSGNVSVHLLNPNPPQRTTPPNDGMSDEMRGTYERYSSYFGRYSVDVAQRRIAHHLTGGTLAEWSGQTWVRDYRLDGDRLVLSADVPHSGQCAILEWDRA